MEQYIEIVIIENLFINSFLYIFTVKFSKERCRKINLVLTVIISTVYSCIIFINKNNLNTIFSRILAIFIAIYILFFPKSVKKYIKLIVIYNFIYFIFIGTIIAITLIFNININNMVYKFLVYMISIIIVYLFLSFLWKMWKSKINLNKLSLKMCIAGCSINAFVDTGNTVCTSEGKSVMFIKENFKKYISNKIKPNGKIELISVNGLEEMSVYFIDEITIISEGSEKKIKNVNIVFSQNLENLAYDALISTDFYLEVIKGGYYI